MRNKKYHISVSKNIKKALTDRNYWNNKLVIHRKRFEFAGTGRKIHVIKKKKQKTRN